MFTFGSLFSGIGGLDLGLELAGMHCKYQVEIDDYATAVLERHWPGVRRWRDVREFIADAKQFHDDTARHGASKNGRQQHSSTGLSKIFSVSLLCGGFPCQPVSVAGHRAGDGDARWLWLEFLACIRIIRPRWVLVENVPGLLSAQSGRLFGGILRDLAACGYCAEWTCIPAAAFDLPHLRWRVFIVAYSNKRAVRHWEQLRSKQGTARSEQAEPQHDGTEGIASDATGAGSLSATQCGIHSSQERPGPRNAELARSSWRVVESCLRRGDSRLPHRVDRLRCLGNAVVPQIAEWLGRRILEYERSNT